MAASSDDPRTRCWAAVAFVLFLHVCRNASAAEAPCGPEDVISSTEVAVRGGEVRQEILTLPAHTDLGIAVFEQGIDVVVELPDFVLTFDNPVRRWAIQRAVFRSGANTQVTVVVRPKERDVAPGRVTIELARVPRARALPCHTAQRLMAQGDAHFARAAYPAAAASYQSAVRALEAADGMPLSAQARLSHASVLYQGVQDWSGAAAASESAARVYRNLRDAYGAARADAMATAARMEVALAMPSEAPGSRSVRARDVLAACRESFSGLAQFHAARGERFDQALALNNRGLTRYYEGEFAAARKDYALALPIYIELHERNRQAQVLQNMALLDYELGHFRSAQESFTKVLGLVDAQANPKLRADVLNNLALAESGGGKLDAALAHYTEALEVLTRIQWPREEARSLHGIGTVYYAMGDREAAGQYFERAVKLRTTELDARGRLSSLRSLGNMLAESGRFREALLQHQEALVLAVAPSDRMRVHVQIAKDLAALGENSRALTELASALELASDQDRIATAQTLAARAALQLTLGELEAARRDVDAAIPVFRELEAVDGEFDALMTRARIAQARGDLAAARTAVDAALEAAAQVRLHSANPEMRIGLWRTARAAFELKMELLQSEQGKPRDLPRELLLLAEGSRARSLEDYRRLTGAGEAAGTSGTDSRRESLYHELAQRRSQLAARLERGGETDARVAAIRAEIATLRREVDLLNTSLATHGARDAVAAAERLPIETIPDDAAVVEYWLGERASFAWAVSGKRIDMVQLGAAADINAKARALHASFQDVSTVPRADRERRARALHDAVIVPLPAWVRGRRSITFIADGALHAIPFAALAGERNGKLRFVAEDHDIALAPSLRTALSAGRGERSPGLAFAALVVADPVYSKDDERFAALTAPQGTVDRARLAPSHVTRGSRSWRRLRGAGREAQALLGLLDPANTQYLEGFDAARDEFLKLDLSRFRIIHIATHAVSEPGSPKFSRVVLSTLDRAGTERVGDVFSGDLTLRPLTAELVVFSGCETALGHEAAGEGLLGLQYSALASGAESVIASLWPVSDRAGQELMNDFYTLLLREHRTPRAALGEATRRARLRHADPVLWAPFELSISSRTSLN
jgi:CHAT domain-containing protein